MSLKPHFLMSRVYTDVLFIHHTHKLLKSVNKKRKEEGSLKQLLHRKQIRNPSKKRTSVCTLQGSLSIEAALALPLFVFAMVCVLYLFEIMATQTVIKSALHSAAKEIATQVSVMDFLVEERVEQKMIESIGEEALERSLLVGGRDGLDCSKTRRYGRSTLMDVCVSYQLKIPVLVFEIPAISKEELIRVKGWTGYEGAGFLHSLEETVYITQTGMVYHKDAHCTYLELSIRSVERESAKAVYEACSRCRWREEEEMVYVTDTGEHYHTTLECAALKRVVYAVKLSEVYGRGGCSRCVK